MQIIVSDAQYVARALHGQEPSKSESGAYFDTAIPENHYVGISAVKRQYNALSRTEPPLFDRFFAEWRKRKR